MSHPEEQSPGNLPASPVARPAPPTGAAAPPPPPPPPRPGQRSPAAPPAYGQPPAPPPPPGHHPGPYGYGQPPYGASPAGGYTPYGTAVPGTKPPRPAVTTAAILLLIGSALMVIGSVLPWLEINGNSINGFDDLRFQDEATGPIYVFLATVLTGFGITFLAAKRVLSVAIIAVVLAAFAALATFGDFSDLSDLRDLVNSVPGNDASYGVGLPMVLLGTLTALAGSITALAKRRR